MPFIYGEEVIVEGTIQEKDIENHKIVLVGAVVCGAEDSRGKQNILCTLEGGEDLPLGLYVRVKGQYKPFYKATNPGAFDSAKYYKSIGIDYGLDKCVLLAKGEKYNAYLEGLFQLKEYFKHSIQNVFPEKEAGLLEAMLLGDKGDMDPEVKRLFQEGGISHIFAISGLHISLIGFGFYKILNRLTVPNKGAVPITIGLLVSYCILCGGAPSAIRATGMLLFMLLGKVLRKNYDLYTTLSLLAAYLCMQNPYVLYHAGFWLSFMAVLGFTCFLPIYTEMLEELPLGRRQKKLILAVLSTVLFGMYSFPLVSYFYYTYPPYSMLLNLLIIPLMQVVMPLGILAMVFGGFCVPFGRFLSYPVRWILWLYEKLCALTLHFPGSQIGIGKPALAKILLFYLGIFLLFRFRKRLRGVVKMVFPILLLCVVCAHSTKGVSITFLDVGQGDGICVQEKGRVLMIDGGSSSNKTLAKYQLVPFLQSMGVHKIDYWFVTHPDADHMNGLCDLLEKEWDSAYLRIGTIVLPAGDGIKDNAKDLLLLAQQRGIPVQYMQAGDSYEDRTITLTCLNPPGRNSFSDMNDASIVLCLEYGALKGLFMGDAPMAVEDTISEKTWFQEHLSGQRLTFLKVGHHGSKYSTGQEFLEETTPMIAVISAGARNRYGHPHEEVLERLSQENTNVFRTDEKGAIMLRLYRNTCEVETFLK